MTSTPRIAAVVCAGTPLSFSMWYFYETFAKEEAGEVVACPWERPVVRDLTLKY